MTLKALEFYSGIGGLHLALKRSTVEATVLRAFDWDPNACEVYATNHGKGIIKRMDISTLTAAKLGCYGASLWLMSPSCQPYTVLNSQAKGAADPRAKSFMHIIGTVLPEMVATQTHPRYLLIENVAGFEASSTRDFLVKLLRQLDYNVLELLITPLQFGIPNSRLRYYLLAKARPLAFARVDEREGCVWRHIPGRGEDWADDRLAGTNRLTATPPAAPLREYLDPDPVAPGDTGEGTSIPDNVLLKWGRLFDIVLPTARRSCCFTRGYTKMAERSGSVLQMNEDLDTTATFNKFLELKACGDPNAVRVLDSLRLRYFSPAELLRLLRFHPLSRAIMQGGPEDTSFTWPDTVSTKTKYKLLGNSINVAVVTVLLDYLFE